MVDINPTEIITLHINNINTPIKTEFVIVDQKNKTQLYVVYRKPSLNIKTYRLEVKG